ncbi:Transposon protein [Arachis hypogaea]|nr:Transposon protein [Arachis hypogaea]
MVFLTPEGGSISTLINPTQGDEEFSMGEVVIQEQEGTKVDEITDVVVTRNDELDSRHELPDHSGIGEEEISVIGISFGSLPLAQKFYANYVKKVGFVTKIRNTNFDKMQKESKIPVNQSIHYTARMYVMLDKEKKSWIVSILELRHSNPCSAKKAIHYREYQELTMHAKSIITDNDEAGIRPNKTYFLAEIEGPEQKSDSEAEKGL